MPDPKLFLLGQQLSVLRPFEKKADRRAHICGGGAGDRQQDPWLRNQRQQVQARAVAPENWRRVALVCDAGLGKSTNLQWLQAQIGRSRRQTAFLVELHKAKHLLADPDLLLEDFAKQIKAKNGKEDKHQLAHLKRLRSSGGITLLLDGLDQLLGQDKDALPLQQLQTLLTCAQWKHCPLWIAGRPHIFQSHWEALFAADGWQFVQVEPLNEATIHFYMANQTVDANLTDLRLNDFPLMATPRYLELLCKCMAGQVKQQLDQALADAADCADRAGRVPEYVKELTTLSVLYHRVFFDRKSGLLASGLRGSEAASIGAWKYGDTPGEGKMPGRIARTAQLLGALAFSMVELNLPNAPFTGAATGDEVERVKLLAANKLVAAGLGTRPNFHDDFEKLIHMNVGAMDYLILAQADKEALFWHDISVQAFFAAYWVMKHSTDDERQVLQGWIDDDKGEPLEGFAELWVLAVLMPDIDKKRWLQVVGPCFQPPPVANKKRGWIKWSRWVMYLVWQRMQEVCPDKIANYRSSFHALRTGSQEQQQIYWEINNGFETIPGGICPFSFDPSFREIDTGERLQIFTRGSWWDLEPFNSKGVETHVDTFKMHRWAVSNEWYEAFDPAHRQERWVVIDENQEEWVQRFGEAAADLCPVVNVNWFDAWAFAQWCEAQLPTSLQWEHACRLGGTDSKTGYWWGNTCNGSECNCQGTAAELPVGTRGKWISGPYIRGLVPVHGVDGHGGRLYPVHLLGLEQMNGNTWEWVISKEGNSCVRGGGWNSSPSQCRSVIRMSMSESTTNRDVGFRLSRPA